MGQGSFAAGVINQGICRILQLNIYSLLSADNKLEHIKRGTWKDMALIHFCVLCSLLLWALFFVSFANINIFKQKTT